MIKVAIIGGLLHSGGKKNLIMEYLRHFDITKIQFDLIADSNSNGIPHDEIKRLGGRTFVITPYNNIVSHLRDLKKIFRENKYDIVHAFDNTLNVFPLVAAKQCGIPVRINESISMGHKGELKNYIKLALRPFSKIGSTIYMSNGIDCGKWQFGDKEYAAGNVHVFKSVINTDKNAFDVTLRKKTRNEFGWEGNVIYGVIARFEMQKNPLFMIDIFNEIAKRQENARLIIIGHGSMLNLMNERIKDYGINDRVENLGRREDIHQFYNAFDAFLLPSLYEGLPIVAPEAQACGLPIFMSTEVTREAAGCDLAYFIPLSSSPSEWAETIVRETSKNIPTRCSHIEELVSAGFDSKAESERMQQFYIDEVNKVKLDTL